MVLSKLSFHLICLIYISKGSRNHCMSTSQNTNNFSLQTIGFDPMVAAEDAASWGIEFTPLDQIWPVADFITVHTPLIPQTKGQLQFFFIGNSI